MAASVRFDRLVADWWLGAVQARQDALIDRMASGDFEDVELLDHQWRSLDRLLQAVGQIASRALQLGDHSSVFQGEWKTFVIQYPEAARLFPMRNQMASAKTLIATLTSARG